MAKKKKKRPIASRDIGLDMGIIFLRFFFDSEHLHYGLWPEDLPVTARNLAQAQQNYEDHIVSHIPPGVRTILDVGCGTGLLCTGCSPWAMRWKAWCPAHSCWNTAGNAWGRTP